MLCVQISYDPSGKEVSGRGWHFIENMKDTQWDFALVLRQKYQEGIFRRSLSEEGARLEAPVELMSVEAGDKVESGGYRVTAVTRDGVTGAKTIIMCK